VGLLIALAVVLVVFPLVAIYVVMRVAIAITLGVFGLALALVPGRQHP
jgi:hypothetical protein